MSETEETVVHLAPGDEAYVTSTFATQIYRGWTGVVEAIEPTKINGRPDILVVLNTARGTIRVPIGFVRPKSAVTIDDSAPLGICTVCGNPRPTPRSKCNPETAVTLSGLGTPIEGAVTVRQLIEELSKMPPDCIVTYEDFRFGPVPIYPRATQLKNNVNIFVGTAHGTHLNWNQVVVIS